MSIQNILNLCLVGLIGIIKSLSISAKLILFRRKATKLVERIRTIFGLWHLSPKVPKPMTLHIIFYAISEMLLLMGKLKCLIKEKTDVNFIP